MAGLYLLNPKRRSRRRPWHQGHRRRNPGLSSTMAWGMGNPRRRRRRARRRNPFLNRRRRVVRRRRRNPVLATFNRPRRRNARRHGFARRGRRRSGGGGGFGLGGIRKLMNPQFALQAVGAGLGVIAGVIVPNTFFQGQTWYAGWTKHVVRAAVAVVLAPMIGRFLPGAIGSSFAVGAIAAVGVGILGEVLGRGFSIGPGDTSQTVQTAFGLSGLGMYVPKMLRGPVPGGINLGLVTPRMTRRTLGGGTVSDAIFGGSGIFSR